METAQTINLNKRNVLARNTPVALVVGAGSFLGSNLVDKLIEKNLQVVGLDDFKNEGKRENLEEAGKNKNFHLITGSLDQIKFEFVRLDYIFVFPDKELDLEDLLKTFKETKCRLLLISSVDLYGSKADKRLDYLNKLEGKLARFAHLNHLNGRVLRLGSVFGPRMIFKDHDPIVKLIQAAVLGDLQKEINLDFSTRALYVTDAIELIVKSVMSGSTALKIFDGVLLSPLKISEIKQVLLDPVWYENRGFTPTELPPWPTPNLEKTKSELNWKPGTDLIFALKQTLNYFKNREIIDDEKKEELEEFKPKAQEFTAFKRVFKPEQKTGVVLKQKKGSIRLKINAVSGKVFSYIALGVILYALIWPLITLGWEVFSFKNNLSQASKAMEIGDLDKGLNSIVLAENGIGDAQKIFGELDILRKISFLDGYFETGDNLINLAGLSQTSAKSTIVGIKALYQGLRAVTGETSGSPEDFFKTAQVELAQADGGFAKLEALWANDQFQKTIPAIFKPRVNSLIGKAKDYEVITGKAKAAATLLPEIIALNGQKNYLILLQNNMELRPGGGFIGSFATVSFEGGKLKKLDVNDVYALDGQLKVHVEPPKEIKEDLGQKDWFLRDSNFEPDFPTSARQAEWFYTKEGGGLTEGVIALDVSAIENLLKALGPLDLADYSQKITPENLFEQTITHAEQGFFPGSQAKKTFLTALARETLNKIFFMPSQNWPGIVSALGKSLEEKHLSLYLNNPKLFSYLISQNWSGSFPGSVTLDKNTTTDFLAPVEANLGGNKANYYLDRNYKLETLIGKDGEVSQRLKINYTNRSPSDVWPGGLYKNRFRIYLPFGTVVSRLSWGEKDITKSIGNFVDYGRSGISVLLELKPKEQKSLILDYHLPSKLKFINNIAKYHLDISKQAGTLKDPFEWRITYPINYRLASDQNDNLAPQEKTISTDLSIDRSFEISFSKSL